LLPVLTPLAIIATALALQHVEKLVLPSSQNVLADVDHVEDRHASGGPMTDEPTPRGGIEGFPTGLSWYQHHRAARVVASASTDATDCALLLAALGIHPGDGLRISSSTATIVVPAHQQM
jgi:hypothetical protein